MLAYQREVAESISKKLPGMLQTIMLAPMFFFKWFCPWKNKSCYSRHSMLTFQLFWVVISTYSYSSIKDKQKTIYAFSSYYFTMKYIGTIQQYHHQHIMLTFYVPYSTMTLSKVSNIIYKFILILSDNTFIMISHIYVSIDVPYIISIFII